MTRLLPWIALFILLPATAFANGEKAPKVAITFHLQSAPEPGKKMTFKWQTALGPMHFRRTSEFKTTDIIGHRPFPSPHVDTEYGMVFKFNKDAQKRLQHMTTVNNGKYLIVFINGTPMDMLKIDKPVSDGIICVWRGLLPSHVHLADSLAPRLGEDKGVWKKRLKEAEKAKKKK